MENNIKEEEIEEYLDDYRVGKNKDKIPAYDTLNVIKNSILCYYNRILKKKYQVSILVKKVRKTFYFLCGI